MIAHICGKVTQVHPHKVLLSCGGISYEVLVAPTVLQRVKELAESGTEVSLVTYHYFQMEPSRGVPVLVGFCNEIEKEFFEVFITVSGIGPRAALRALIEPISRIARAIDEGDVEFLRSLPGIGPQRAREIIAKLQKKVGKFGLMQDAPSSAVKEPGRSDLQVEALAVLLQLQYKKPEAEAMVKKALERAPHISTTEELLNEVYSQKKLH
jgi:holliday junction DNA helicase RuvA